MDEMGKKTVHLGIAINTSPEELFKDWRDTVNGDNPKSMANLIDDFVGDVAAFIENKPITVEATSEMTEIVGLNANNELVVKPSSDVYEPDNITIGLNAEQKLEVKNDLEIDGGFL